QKQTYPLVRATLTYRINRTLCGAADELGYCKLERAYAMASRRQSRNAARALRQRRIAERPVDGLEHALPVRAARAHQQAGAAALDVVHVQQLIEITGKAHDGHPVHERLIAHR